MTRAPRPRFVRAALYFCAPLAALTLSACQHKVLVRSCITPEQLAQLEQAEPPKVKDRLTGKADEDVRVIAGSNIRLRSWGHGLLDTLRVCSG